MNGSSKYLLWFIAVCLIALMGCSPTTPTTSTSAVKPSPTIKPAQNLLTVTAAPTHPISTPLGNQVDAGDYFFYPSALTVTVGTTVRWNHVGSTGHDVTAVDRSWGTTLIPLAGHFEHTFTREGIFDYTCVLHYPAMQGTIIVIRK